MATHVCVPGSLPTHPVFGDNASYMDGNGDIYVCEKGGTEVPPQDLIDTLAKQGIVIGGKQTDLLTQETPVSTGLTSVVNNIPVPSDGDEDTGQEQ